MADRVQEFKRAGTDLVRWPLRLLFPPSCLGCRNQVLDPGTVCGRCWPRLRFIEEPWCAVLGTPFSHDMGEGLVSADAIADPPPFRRARATVAYGGIAREMVQALKFRDRTELAPWMALWMLRAGRELIAEAEVIAAVPLHRQRFLWRRFNQSAELARGISARTGIAFEPDVVSRTKRTRQQIGLTLKDRQTNVRGAFRVPTEAEIKVRGRRVLLIDDVYTTGATAVAATKALLRGGAAAVDVLTFARVLTGDFRAGDDEPI